MLKHSDPACLYRGFMSQPQEEDPLVDNLEKKRPNLELGSKFFTQSSGYFWILDNPLMIHFQRLTKKMVHVTICLHSFHLSLNLAKLDTLRPRLRLIGQPGLRHLKRIF